MPARGKLFRGRWSLTSSEIEGRAGRRCHSLLAGNPPLRRHRICDISFAFQLDQDSLWIARQQWRLRHGIGSTEREAGVPHLQKASKNGWSYSFLRRANLSSLLAAFGRDDALRLQLLAAKPVVAFGIKLCVGQRTADGRHLIRCERVRAVIPGGLSCALRQDQLPVRIDHGEPLHTSSQRRLELPQSRRFYAPKLFMRWVLLSAARINLGN